MEREKQINSCENCYIKQKRNLTTTQICQKQVQQLNFSKNNYLKASSNSVTKKNNHINKNPNFVKVQKAAITQTFQLMDNESRINMYNNNRYYFININQIIISFKS